MTDTSPLPTSSPYHPVRLRALSLLQFAEVYENMPEDDEEIDALQDEMERRTWPRSGASSESKTFWALVEVEKLKAKLAAIQKALDHD